MELAADKRRSFFFRLGAGLTTSHRKAHVKKYYVENMGNLHNQQPHNRPTHFSPNNIPVVKLRMRYGTRWGNRNVCGD